MTVTQIENAVVSVDIFDAHSQVSVEGGFLMRLSPLCAIDVIPVLS